MVMRALQATGAGQQVPENALVAFGVLDAEGLIRDGGIDLSSDDLVDMIQGLEGPVRSMADDVSDLKAALNAHPGIFRYLQSAVVDGAASKSAAKS